MSDNQTPESREELRKQVNDALPSYLDRKDVDSVVQLISEKLAIPTRYSADGRGWVHIDDVEQLITTATQASNKALLSRVFEKFIANGSVGLADVIDAELASLERQQLGKESSHE